MNISYWLFLVLSWHHHTARLRVLFTGGDKLHLRPPEHAPFQLVNIYGNPAGKSAVMWMGKDAVCWGRKVAGHCWQDPWDEKWWELCCKTAVNRYQHRQKKCAKERRQNQTYSIVFSLNFWIWMKHGIGDAFLILLVGISLAFRSNRMHRECDHAAASMQKRW